MLQLGKTQENKLLIRNKLHYPNFNNPKTPRRNAINLIYKLII